MLLHALFGRSVRTTREAASLSNRLLPAEAGKKKLMQKGAMQKNRENPKMAFNCEIQIQFALCNFFVLTGAMN